ncbi:MAG: UPF0262 family protein [Alphaproteobacteria bacterium]|nr:UPF0262 family protein [Alphaproteobacteria bacterium]
MNRERFRIRSLHFAGDLPESLGKTPCENVQTTVRDLVADSLFRPVENENGPYDVELAIIEGRLALKITESTGKDLPILVLSVRPYQKLISDYFILCQSYQEARQNAGPSRLEAIDMGRRALHNEGADLLQTRLADKVEMDHRTARRLFTLICVLHGRRPRNR